MARRIPLVRLIYPGAPSDERGTRVVGMSVYVTPPIAHPMVGREDPGCGIVAVKVVDEFDHILDALIDDFDVVEVLFRVGPVGVSRCIEAKQVEKKDVLVFAEGGI